MKPGSAEWLTWSATPEATLELFCCRGRSDGPTVVITAGVHGDEYEGPTAIAALAKQIDPKSVSGSIIAIPVANPSAFRAGTRLNPEDGLNLARNFPGLLAGSPTQQLAYQLFETIAVHADFLIDLHSGGAAYVFHPVAGFYGEAIARNPSFSMARRLQLTNLWQLPPTDGVLSCEAWKRGISAVGAEYLGAAQLSACGVADYHRGVLSCLRYAGQLNDDESPLTPQSAFGGDWQLAQTDGIFRAFRDLGSRVTEQTEIAEIVNIRGHRQQLFTAPCAGVLLGLRSKAFIQQGDWAILLGKPLGEFID